MLSSNLLEAVQGTLVAGAKIFDERTDQSETKARIIQKYFYAWARVITPSAKQMGGKIAYIDLYAGPGRYKDGAASTPLLVLEHAIDDPDMRSMLVTYFNDADESHTSTLQAEIDALPGIERLKYKPTVNCDARTPDPRIMIAEVRARRRTDFNRTIFSKPCPALY
jgi:three-Cys-motif partner protein